MIGGASMVRRAMLFAFEKAASIASGVTARCAENEALISPGHFKSLDDMKQAHWFLAGQRHAATEIEREIRGAALEEDKNHTPITSEKMIADALRAAIVALERNERAVEAARKHIHSFAPGTLVGSELNLALMLATIDGSEVWSPWLTPGRDERPINKENPGEIR